jgi:hypothetical protein
MDDEATRRAALDREGLAVQLVGKKRDRYGVERDQRTKASDVRVERCRPGQGIRQLQNCGQGSSLPASKAYFPAAFTRVATLMFHARQC